MPNPHPFEALILAAGLGSRLGHPLSDLPKPLLELDGVTLIARAIALLERHGMTRLTVVVGYRADALGPVVRSLYRDARIVLNPTPAQNGSMRSLALGYESFGDTCPGDLFVVEGDVLFGADALEALSTGPRADATVLCSSPTGADDEVWVQGRGDRIEAIGKKTTSGIPILGELVGLTRVRRKTLRNMVRGHRADATDSEKEHYEERLATLSDTHDLRAHVVEGLIWTEIDDPRQLERAVKEVLPSLVAAEKQTRRNAMG